MHLTTQEGHLLQSEFSRLRNMCPCEIRNADLDLLASLVTNQQDKADPTLDEMLLMNNAADLLFELILAQCPE